jgi:hypothetical protein
MLGVCDLDDLTAGSRANKHPAIGHCRQRERLRISRVECHGPGRTFLGGLTKDLSRISGRGIHCPILSSRDVPHPFRGERSGGQQGLTQTHVSLVRNNNALAAMLGKRRDTFLTPGLDFGPRSTKSDQACTNQEPDEATVETLRRRPGRAARMIHVVLIVR